MATRRPAKIAIGKSQQETRKCHITGKTMTAVKVYRRNGSSGMHWVVVEDFDGSEQAIERMVPIR